MAHFNWLFVDWEKKLYKTFFADFCVWVLGFGDFYLCYCLPSSNSLGKGSKMTGKQCTNQGPVRKDWVQGGLSLDLKIQVLIIGPRSKPRVLRQDRQGRGLKTLHFLRIVRVPATKTWKQRLQLIWIPKLLWTTKNKYKGFLGLKTLPSKVLPAYVELLGSPYYKGVTLPRIPSVHELGTKSRITQRTEHTTVGPRGTYSHEGQSTTESRRQYCKPGGIAQHASNIRIPRNRAVLDAARHAII